MFPLRDSQVSSTLPVVTWSLLALNVAAFVLTGLGSDDAVQATVLNYGLVPGELLGQLPASGPPELLTLLTTMFMHGGLLHLAGNMWFLHLFGDNVEDRLGHVVYTGFYFAVGLAGSLLTAALDPTSNIPVVGASGAISGIIGAYVVWYPAARITTLWGWGFIWRAAETPAWIFIGLWFALQLGGFLLGGGGIAWGAHLGGFLAGLGFALLQNLLVGGSEPPAHLNQRGPWRRRR